MSTQPLLQARGLSMRFGGVRALDGVDLDVYENEIVGIIGPNGAGKTTLFNVLSGVNRATAGSIQMAGRELVGCSADVIARLGISRTYQKVRPFPRMTALQNVMVPIINQLRPAPSVSQAEALAARWLDRVGITAQAHVEARRLNLFHRKKVELARALAGGARIVLLDEVMAGLTAVEADAAVALLHELRAELRFSIVCVEHLMRVIMTLSERIVVLDHGRVIARGSPAEIAADPSVQRVYLGDDHA